MTLDPRAARTVTDLVTGAWRTQALYVAVRLRLPDHVAERGRPTGVAELAAATGADEDVVRRLMRLLVCEGVFDGSAAEGYRSTAVSEALRDRPGSLRDMCLLYGNEFYQAWGHADHALTTDGTTGFERAFGRPLIEHLSGDPEAAELFQNALRANSFFFEDVPRVFDFSKAATVVDVGGGSGLLLAAVLRAAPDAHGVLADLEHMAPIAREHLRAEVGPDRADVVAHDVFESVPPGGDVYLLSRVLGDWADEDAVRLLDNCRREIGESGRVLVVERVTSDDASARLPALWDLHLRVVNGGRQRTLAQWESLFDRAGLRLERVEELPMENSALVVAPA